jgi:ubiquinone/menaquinone biosynthesis C-methylase UbiE
MSHAAADLAGYYAARAAEYERIYDKPERQMDLAVLRDRIPGALADRDVIEIACGTGYWTQFIAPSARSVSAIDINDETLAIARTKHYPPGRVTFEVADVYALAPRFTGFTGALAGFWWSHVPVADRKRFVAAVHRTLAPGAVVVILDNRYVPGSSTPISHVDAEGNSYQRRALADGSEHVVLKNFPTEDELRAEIGDAASAIEYVELEYYWLLGYTLHS